MLRAGMAETSRSLWEPNIMRTITRKTDPVADAAPLSAQSLSDATLKIYPGLPHGMCTPRADTINADLVAFIGK